MGFLLQALAFGSRRPYNAAPLLVTIYVSSPFALFSLPQAVVCPCVYVGGVGGGGLSAGGRQAPK